ncbi:MAG: sulfur-oxidizing protein SoxA [Gammaproteobacteria bacterium]|jgi:sulfur-oxidizing protein SoxA
MRKIINTVSAVLLAGLFGSTVNATTPAEDLANFQSFYTERFPDTSFSDFGNGVYSIDAVSRETFEAIEEFPQYEIDIEKGDELFKKPFANGTSYFDCFGMAGVRHEYPHFDSDSGSIITLEQAINDCRKAAGEKPLKYKKGDIAAISAYMAYESRGEVFDIKVPNDPRAVDHYQRGRNHFYMKRGQLNLSCADCHMHNAGMKIRADLLSPALGHLTHFPVYRAKWGSLGTAHRRFGGCNKQVRAKPFPAQSDEYKALEYFLTYMSNGLVANGPATRK